MNGRRHFLLNVGSAAIGAGSFALAASRSAEFAVEGRRLEKSVSGRLGFAMLDTESGATASYRGAERFPFCSTFKFLAAAYVLKRVDRGEEHLDHKMAVAHSDLLSHSPVTEKHLGPAGMTLAELCEAAVTQSDNAAANLLLRSFGGPAGLTRFARSIGDPATRLDRTEMSLNEARPGDPRDTTTPIAMANTLNTLLLGSILSKSSRELLTRWLVENKTGDARLRAGVPKDWRVGDKTGTGRLGTTNDIGILFPPHRKPILIAAYLTQAKGTPDQREAVLAQVARLIAG